MTLLKYENLSEFASHDAITMPRPEVVLLLQTCRMTLRSAVVPRSESAMVSVTPFATVRYGDTPFVCMYGAPEPK